MVSEDIKELLHDQRIDSDVKVSVLPLLIEQARASQRGPWKNFLTSAPFAALLSAVLVAGITELIRQDVRGEEMSHETSLERQKFQYEVITASLSEAKSPNQRAETLRFLHDINIIDGLDDNKLKEWASGDAAPPAFAAAITSTASSRVYIEPERLTVNQYKSLYGDDAYGPDTSTLLPQNDVLTEILGKPGETVETCLTVVQLPYLMVMDWNKRQTVNGIQVHTAAAPYFENAFQNIVESGVQDHAKIFNGGYNARKKRGGTEWSPHAWGIAIAIDATFNAPRSGPDIMTMHPSVVEAFKDAGFAWAGDLGYNGSQFIISTETLKNIAASGVDYSNGCPP